ncbi:MAG: leucyl/phenylalanyl-tRNA--protein transferase, partial [Bdellovibrionales bacterium]
AYSVGIFPWPQPEYPILWFCPNNRGILHFNQFHLPQRFKKDLKKYTHIKVTRNQAFEKVIEACSIVNRKSQMGTWITDEMKFVYIEMFKKGFARSWEVWDADELVGGGYGVLVKGVFSGESLFHYKTNMSKLALIAMVEDMKKEGHEWMDTQMVTPLLASFGAREISKHEYLKLLKQRQLTYL